MKFKHLLFFTIIYLFQIQASWAQEGTLSGKISNSKDKETLIGVNVVASEKLGAITDVNGNYTLKLPEGKYTITYRYIGYKVQTKEVEIKNGEVSSVDIILDESASQLDEVVVSAGKFEQKVSELVVSMEVIKPALVQNKCIVSIDKALDQTPGVNVMDGQANIRGGSGFSYGAGSRVMVMVDDLPMLTADANDVKWNFLPVENLEQIEVIKGASSALFGSSALNGVINIRTAYPKDKPETKVNVFSGVYDDFKDKQMNWWWTPESNYKSNTFLNNKQQTTFKGGNPMYHGANFFHSRKIKNFDFVIGGNMYSDDGYKQYATEQRGRINFNTRYRFQKVKGLSAGLNGNFMETKGGLFLIWQDAGAGALKPIGGSISNYTTTRASIDPYVTYYAPNNDRHSLRTRAFRTVNMNDTHQNSTADLYYAEYQYQKRTKKNLTFTAGTATTQSIVRSQLYQDHKGQNYSGFVQMDKKYFKKLLISFGARGEYFKVDTASTLTNINITSGKDTLRILKNSKVKPVCRIGASYELTKTTFIRTSFGQGYRFPSIAEKYIKTIASGLPIYSNPAIQPETGWSGEVGIKQGFKVSQWMGYLDVAAFWQEYTNMMQFSFGNWGNPMTDTLGGLGFKSINIGKTRINGLDISLVGKGKIGPIETTVFSGYTFMNARDLSAFAAGARFNPNPRNDTVITNNFLVYRFKHMAKSDVQLDYKKWSAGLSIRYNSYMQNIDRVFDENILVKGLYDYRKKHNKGATVYDFRISYKTSKTSKFAVIINNMFNRTYMGRPADIQSPRTVGVQYSLNF